MRAQYALGEGPKGLRRVRIRGWQKIGERGLGNAGKSSYHAILTLGAVRDVFAQLGRAILDHRPVRRQEARRRPREQVRKGREVLAHVALDRVDQDPAEPGDHVTDDRRTAVLVTEMAIRVARRVDA